VFNLMVVDLTGVGADSRLLFDHHQPHTGKPPHLSPEYPLPNHCWLDNQRVAFNSSQGVKTVRQAVNLDAGPESIEDEPPPLPKRSPLLPANNPKSASGSARRMKFSAGKVLTGWRSRAS